MVLAHGAGAPMDHPSLTAVAEALAANGLRVVRFEFPYMRRRRTEGVRRGPDPPAVQLETWQEVIEKLGGGAGLVIGGKSMGAPAPCASTTVARSLPGGLMTNNSPMSTGKVYTSGEKAGSSTSPSPRGPGSARNDNRKASGYCTGGRGRGE